MIVVGVLLALAGDAAWAERSERAREQGIIADLLDEFRENESRLANDIATNTRARVAGAAWFEAMAGEVAVSPDSLAALYFSSQATARFDPITGAETNLHITYSFVLVGFVVETKYIRGEEAKQGCADDFANLLEKHHGMERINTNEELLYLDPE